MTPVVSPRTPEGSRRSVLRVREDSERHTGTTVDLDATEPRKPSLRIVPDGGRHTATPGAPVLLAGADALRRGVLREEFGTTFPPLTKFAEADDVAGVLERAGTSRMVILAGELDDADTESLTRLLGRRHPELPVIRIDAPVPALAGGRG